MTPVCEERRRKVSGKDIKQISAVATRFKMTNDQRRDFGDFIEDEKAMGIRGSRNERGDFTWAELEQKAKEFLGLDYG